MFLDMKSAQSKETVFIGTYTYGKSEGIYAIDFDAETGSISNARLAAKLDNPAYLAISTNNKYLYAAMESDTFDGAPGGGVGAFSIREESGKLGLLNLKSAAGNTPCHITADRLNKYLFTANYNEGTFTSFSINSDGSIGDIIFEIMHKGFGPNRERQEKPHIHCAVLNPEEDHLCVADLGIDKIMVYSFNVKSGALNHKQNLDVAINPGSGPRQLEFHPNNKFAYLVNELKSDIVVLEYLSVDCSFNQIQHISALPDGFDKVSWCAAIHISPDGNYLYASNRGHDSIAVFHIDKDTGKLTHVSYTHTAGAYPRDFAIHPNGKFLIAANQNSGSLVPFSIDKNTGKLAQCGEPCAVPDPTCVKFQM
jgi:6-phosphogluconolactonase